MRRDIDHIFLVTIDCGRQDYFYTPMVKTPSLDRLTQRAKIFTNAFSQTNTTIASHVSMFSSKYLCDHGVYSNFEKPMPGSLSLQAILERSGWRTFAYTGVGFLSWLMGDWCTFNQRISWVPSLENPDKRGYGLRKIGVIKNRRSATKTVNKVISDLKKGLKKDFYWIHFFDAHIPQRPPRRFLRRHYKNTAAGGSSCLEEVKRLGLFVSPGILQEISPRRPLAYYPAAYQATLEYVDSEIGRLIQYLVRSGIWERCLFIVTADHGENLTENGVFCDHSKLFDETTKVPLYWCDPDIKQGGEITGLVQHADIYPSILQRLGLEVPADIRGKSLYPIMEGVATPGHDFVFAEHARGYQYTIRTEEWQYIWKNTEKEHPHGLVLEDNFLINRKDSKKTDGYENLAHQYPGICEELRALGEETLSSPLPDDSESEAVPEAIAKVLKGLGYL